MRWTHRFAVALRSVFTRRRVEQELDAELQFHLDQQIAENIAAGMSTASARAAALRAFGSVAYTKDECRASLGLRLLDELQQDARYTIRALRSWRCGANSARAQLRIKNSEFGIRCQAVTLSGTGTAVTTNS